ncbi:MAG: hypothetical protein IJU64_06645 [Bacilli bacterium]|nr:hypothetical protein [Bacilli bacterium]
MNKYAIRGILASLVAILVPVFALTVSMAWFLLPGGQTNVVDGEIGLRSYYYTGDGTPAHPYEITSPNHLYNLTRLQSLGMYGTPSVWQMGHYFTEFEGIDDFVPGFYCLEDNRPVKYLDMSAWEGTLLPIGSEGTPFCGEFRGNDIVIKNLHIAGNPEDIGMFGYISQEGYVHNVITQDITIESTGYNPTEGDDDNVLFSADVDDFATAVNPLYDDADYFASEADLLLYDDTRGSVSLKKRDGMTHRSYINNPSNLESAGESQTTAADYTKYAKGWFKPVFPSKTAHPDDPFTYEWRSSIGFLKKEQRDVDGDGKLDEVMGIDLGPLKDSKDFNSGALKEVRTRIYLVASVRPVSLGVTFSRVIQSYTLSFLSNGTTWEEGKYSLDIYCDYLHGEGAPNYHHGNNIGFLAGHLDGQMTYCYVFGGTLKFNQTDNVKTPTETDTGLVGEMDSSLINEINPDFGLTDHGDTGVMNFTRIYSMIRSDFNAGDAAFAGSPTDSSSNTKYFVSYGQEGGSATGDHLAESLTFDRYKEFLRHDEADPVHYVTSFDISDFTSEERADIPPGFGSNYTIPENQLSKFQSVDFLWNKIIQDDKENGIDRGMGVFKLVTTKNDAAASGAYGTYWRDNMGQCQIINGSTPKTKVYFSTAECDWTRTGFAGWTGSNYPQKATTLPSYPNFEYPDIHSFDYPFSRDFNYVFELDLAEENKPVGKNYMFNTDSPFLQTYLYSKLRDQENQPVEIGSSRFGFMFRSSLNEPINALSSYMPIKKPDQGKARFETSEGTRYYPANSIVFRIESAFANVSVVGNGNDIGIYSFDPTKSTNDIKECYTMKSRNTGAMDSHRYFKYDFEEGTTATAIDNTVEGNMTDSGVLYAHIFTLPHGDYIIGASGKSNQGGNSANLYFLAVQGQSTAELGAADIISIGGTAKPIDFLRSNTGLDADPIIQENLNKAEFSFRAYFDNTPGKMEVTTHASGDIQLLFNHTEGNACTTSVLAYCRASSPSYYLNSKHYTATTKSWPEAGGGGG